MAKARPMPVFVSRGGRNGKGWGHTGAAAGDEGGFAWEGEVGGGHYVSRDEKVPDTKGRVSRAFISHNVLRTTARFPYSLLCLAVVPYLNRGSIPGAGIGVWRK